MSESKNDRLRRLFEENDLIAEDTMKLKMGGKQIPIILRTGIDKIQAKQKIKVSYDILYHSDDLKRCVIKATGIKGNQSIETFGEVNEKNCKSDYPILICEKRAMARAVLKLAGFYELGVYSEGEMDGLDR